MSLDAVVLASSWLPSRTPRAVMNERLFGALSWTGDIYVCDEQKGPSDSRTHRSRFEIHRLSNWSATQTVRVLDRLGMTWAQDVPDRYIEWAARAAVAARRRIRKTTPDVLVSVSRAHASHVGGLWLKRWFPGVPWVALFSDPWVDLEQFGYASYRPWTRHLNLALESQVLASADLLLFTSQETIDLLARRYPLIRNRAAVLSQCFEAQLFPAAADPGTGARLMFRHLGDFYGARSPRPLLEAVVRVEERLGPQPWSFELIGRFNPGDAEACKALMERTPSVKQVKEVPYLDSLKRMSEADVLLVIDAPADVSPFRPSKLVEYVGANRPILGLTPDGASANMLRDVGCPVANVADPVAIASALESCLDAWRSGGLARLRPPAQARMAYEHHQVARRFELLVTELLARTPGSRCFA